MDLSAANIDRYIAERVRAAREAIASEPPGLAVADDPMYADDIRKRPFVNLRGGKIYRRVGKREIIYEISPRQIRAIRSCDKLSCITTLDGQEHLCDGTLSEFVRLFPSDLLRVRRDLVVNHSLISEFHVLPRGCGEAKRRRLVVDGLPEPVEVARREVPEVERHILEQAEFDRIFDELAPTEDPMGVKLVVPRHQRGHFARYLPPMSR
ncbi:MAG: hypothetical protein EPN70_10125 [Paraburkholderia sp.]|uniref:LytTR family transcriptional regulator DNA-binding domain-containing protein n=1 Tax=Paraburkholderia sp. TaxID=1926495 RepID=UPI00121AF425|nr:LytTR family transcriptional regulator DNA-binding domain-containing protein [Paraburkholderia sp.]TAM04912.1 MAG: hypothetical protein EPN70_10125 [Paraburkholderia sp.]TAM29584.1 MAG: hypothetical protein EPN59_11590 [Paraburkholderia sp.]